MRSCTYLDLLFIIRDNMILVFNVFVTINKLIEHHKFNVNNKC